MAKKAKAKKKSSAKKTSKKKSAPKRKVPSLPTTMPAPSVGDPAPMWGGDTPTRP